MRRLLAVALAAAVPALAAAQTTGTLTGLTNNLLGAQQCAGTTSLEVFWTMAPRPPAQSVPGTGTVRVFASNKPRTATTDDPRTCYIASLDTTTDATIKMSEVATFDDVPLASGREVIAGADLASMAADLGIDCSAETTSTVVYMCALAYPTDTSTDHTGYANGNFTLNTRKPLPVGELRVESAESALVVRWTEATSGENATEFRVEAATTDARDTAVHTVETNASPARVGGLVNGALYTVKVFAISAAGTESDAAQGSGTPAPTTDFWERYDDAVGVEQGGCATGAAGAFAMLGAAALVRLRRRKP